MKIYTKGGDRGTTSLVQTKNISKSDDRVQCVGTIDELTSHIGLVKTMLEDGPDRDFLTQIQRTLILVMAGIADPYKKDYRISGEETEKLEREIDRIEALFQRPKEFILPGGSRLSAEIDVTRTVARRAERALALVSVRYGADNGSKTYMNRLADYLYVLARLEDSRQEKNGTSSQTQAKDSLVAGGAEAAGQVKDAGPDTGAVVREVLRRMSMTARVDLKIAKRLIEKIEAEAARRGLAAVIAVCNPEGNPVAVHVMDGAFLVSFDVATKKAYTAVAVRMSTMELSKLAQPGQTFYGVDKMENGKIVVFGGGVPLKAGDTIIGGLGISGGTGEQDHSLAEYGLSVLAECLQEDR